MTFTACGEFAGNRLTLLREDLLPLAGGGSKVRIALELIADARSKGCDHLVAYGNRRSNSARAVALLCARERLGCTVVSPVGTDGEREDTVNSSLVKLSGARIVECRGDDSVAKTIRGEMEALAAAGHRPYYVFGDETGRGNERVLASAYGKVGAALAAEIASGRLDCDLIALAVGTGSTCAGLAAGMNRAGVVRPLVGFSIARSAERCRREIAGFLDAAGGAAAPEVLESALCGGYGGTCADELAFLTRFAAENSVFLDPVYSGKALWGLDGYLRDNHITDRDVLFIHTGSWPLVADGLVRKEQ